MKAQRRELRQLARAYGVNDSYESVDGRIHQAEDDVLVALLRALGAPIDDSADASGALREKRARVSRRVIEPVAVIGHGRPSSLRLRLGGRTEAASVDLHVADEDGDERVWNLASVITEGAAEGRLSVDLSRLGYGATTPGYLQGRLEGDGLFEEFLVIVAPRPAAPGRAWGAFVPVHALRSEADWGSGSYSEMAEIADIVSGFGASMLGSLPLYPAFLDPPADPSPYRPVSRLAYNEVFVDPRALPELGGCEEAKQVLRERAFQGRVEAAHKNSLVDYEELARLKRAVLEPLAAFVRSGGAPDRQAELDRFSAARPELVAYAEFRAAAETAGHRGAPDGADRRTTSFDYHLYSQWAAHSQLCQAADRIGLYADLPIGVHPEGFDTHYAASSFVHSLSCGAPPDAFFGSGQDWGFPPLHPESIRETHYGYFRQVLARALRHARYLRIDHVMGLHRLWMIPQGCEASHGAYVSYKPEELHAVLMVEAHRAGAVLVGEDLGTVPDEVRRRMGSDRMLRSWVFQFESTAEDPLPKIPRRVLASLGTHDLPRFGTFLEGADIEERGVAARWDEKNVRRQLVARRSWRRALLRSLKAPKKASEDAQTMLALKGALLHLAASRADLVLVDLEETWGEREPQNRPGTGPEAMNWRRRCALSLEEIRKDQQLAEVLVETNRLRDKKAPK